MKNEENFKVTGHVRVHSGIPRISEDFMMAMSFRYGGKFLRDYGKDSHLESGDNLVLDSGKKMILKRMFGEKESANDIIFTKMLLGDGSNDFLASGEFINPPRFPEHADTTLENLIVSKEVDYVSPTRKTVDGYEKSIVCSFFSRTDINAGTIFKANNVENYINETGLCLLDAAGNDLLLSKYVLRNYVFKFVKANVLTIEWVIRIS